MPPEVEEEIKEAFGLFDTGPKNFLDKKEMKVIW